MSKSSLSRAEKLITQIKDATLLALDYRKISDLAIKDAAKNVLRIKDREYAIQIKDLDITINIAQSLLALSLTLFAIFFSIPSLQVELLLPTILLIVSAVFLIIMIFTRRSKSRGLNRIYSKEIITQSEDYLERARSYNDSSRRSLKYAESIDKELGKLLKSQSTKISNKKH